MAMVYYETDSKVIDESNKMMTVDPILPPVDCCQSLTYLIEV